MNVNAKALSKLSVVAAAIAPSRMGPMYANLLLRPGEQGEQEIVATDLTTSFIAALPTEGPAVGIAVNAKFFAALVALYDEPLAITVGGKYSSELDVKTHRAVSHLRGVPLEDYPAVTISTEGMVPFIEMTGADLKLYVKRLEATAAPDEYEFVTFTGDVVQSYTKYAMSYKDIDLEKTILRIPLSAFKLLTKVIDDDDQIVVWHDEHDVVFAGPTYKLGTKLGSGGFVDAKRYKTGVNKMVTVSAADLASVLSVTKSEQGHLAFAVTVEGVQIDFYSLREEEPVFRFTIEHTTPPKNVQPFTLLATTPVLRPIVAGLGKDSVAFGIRETTNNGSVGIIMSDGYAQLFAQANPTVRKKK